MWDYPSLGTEIELVSDWIFDAYAERRNRVLFELMPALDANYPNLFDELWEKDCSTFYSGTYKIASQFAKGTQFRIDRIYLKNNASNFDSITFKTLNFPSQKIQVFKKEYTISGNQAIPHNVICTKTIKQLRFWAKLNDVRKMDIKILKL